MGLDDTLFLISGYAGFIGRALISYLAKRHAFVIGFDSKAGIQPDADAGGARSNSQGLMLKQGTYYECTEEIKAALGSPGILHSVAINLAGLSAVGRCEKAPGEAYVANVQQAFEFAKFCQTVGISRYVYPSTGYVYGDSSRSPHGEDDPPRPSNVYINTKIAGEALLREYSKASGIDMMILRLSNVYGSESSEETVVGTLIRQAREGSPLTVMDGSPVRDFIYIEDVVEAMVRLSCLPLIGGCEAFNVSTGIATSIERLVALFADGTGMKKGGVRGADLAEAKSCLVLSNAKMARRLRWVPSVTVDIGVGKILGGR